MMRYTDEFAALERRYTRQTLAGLSYHEALGRFTALWIYARTLSPDFPGRWEEDIEADLTLARVLNGRPAGL